MTFASVPSTGMPTTSSFGSTVRRLTRSTFDRASPLYSIAEYIVLDVALGGAKGGPIKASPFPMEMIVDYGRVYSLQ